MVSILLSSIQSTYRAVSCELASADVEGAKKFMKDFNKIIEDSGYHPEQIFNVDETKLFWKKDAREILHP